MHNVIITDRIANIVFPIFLTTTYFSSSSDKSFLAIAYIPSHAMPCHAMPCHS
jgi:hypothetical protein